LVLLHKFVKVSILGIITIVSPTNSSTTSNSSSSSSIPTLNSKASTLMVEGMGDQLPQFPNARMALIINTNLGLLSSSKGKMLNTNAKCNKKIT